MFSSIKPKKYNFVTCSIDRQNNEDSNSTFSLKGKVECPKCKKKAKVVLGKTVEHLLTLKAKAKLSCFDGFNYCKTPSCEVVYFNERKILTQKDMHVVVGAKEGAKPSILCYCFEWSKEKIAKEIEENGTSLALTDIKHKMHTIGCQCEILNPSGVCCLGDVSKAIKELKNSSDSILT